MSSPGDLVYDVTTADFAGAVVERSFTTPVLVDFWAPWCGPCLQLSPVLDAVVRRHAGALVLAKVDTQAEPALGSAQRVTTLPTVRLFFGGRVVAEFIGALSGASIEAFVARHQPSPADRLCAQGRQQLVAGRRVEARADFRSALELEPGHVQTHAELARRCYLDGDAQGLREHAAAVPDHAEPAERTAALLRAWDLRTHPLAAAGALAYRSHLAVDPTDASAHLGLGYCLVGQGRWPEALAALLEAVRSGHDEHAAAASSAMAMLFAILGDDDEHTKASRELLGEHRRSRRHPSS